MTQTDQILMSVLSELKELTAAVKGNNLTTCYAKDALLILGLKDPGHLTYFFNEGVLTRRGGQKSGYVYYKSELYLLAGKLKDGSIQVPKLKPSKAS